MEKPLCFIAIMLKVAPDVKGTPNIRRRIKQRLLEWEQGKFQMLTSNTILCAAAYTRRKKGKANVYGISKVFTSLACRGQIRSAIMHACERDKGGMLMPGDIETGDLLAETLCNKHPDGRDVNTDNLPVFSDCLDLTDVMVTDDTVEEVAKHMAGGAGSSGFYSSSLSQCLFKYGGTSTKLRKTMASLVE